VKTPYSQGVLRKQFIYVRLVKSFTYWKNYQAQL